MAPGGTESGGGESLPGARWTPWPRYPPVRGRWYIYEVTYIQVPRKSKRTKCTGVKPRKIVIKNFASVSPAFVRQRQPTIIYTGRLDGSTSVA